MFKRFIPGSVLHATAAMSSSHRLAAGTPTPPGVAATESNSEAAEAIALGMAVQRVLCV